MSTIDKEQVSKFFEMINLFENQNIADDTVIWAEHRNAPSGMKWTAGNMREVYRALLGLSNVIDVLAQREPKNSK